MISLWPHRTPVAKPPPKRPWSAWAKERERRNRNIIRLSKFLSQRQIAQRFGLERSTVSHIILGYVNKPGGGVAPPRS